MLKRLSKPPLQAPKPTFERFHDRKPKKLIIKPLPKEESPFKELTPEDRLITATAVGGITAILVGFAATVSMGALGAIGVGLGAGLLIGAIAYYTVQ